MMGGRVAEELFLNTMTTGAGNDIEQASDLARKMVCEFGMATLGPMTFGKKEEQIFLGREISQHRDFSEETAQQDRPGSAPLRGSKATSRRPTSWRTIATRVEKIAEALLEREVLDASEIQMLIEGKELPARVNPNAPPPKDDVQQVLKPAPGQQPNVAPERPAQA